MIEPADPELRLLLAYVPARRRAGLAALLALDARFAGLTSAAREPQLGIIRLAWWRDALIALDGRPPPAEPLLAAVAAAVLPGGVSGAALAEMEEGWSALLDGSEPAAARIAAHARFRGGTLFAAAARLLGGEAGAEVRAAGERWALMRLATSAGELARPAQDALAGDRVGRAMRWPVALRPLGQLAALAAMDVVGTPPRGSPRRLVRLATLRLFGR